MTTTRSSREARYVSFVIRHRQPTGCRRPEVHRSVDLGSGSDPSEYTDSSAGRAAPEARQKRRRRIATTSSARIPGSTAELDAALDRPVHSIRQIILLKLRRENVITQHYKYVDGTSFSAPIVSSLVAQMLEANPALTPQNIKRILISTAERLPHYEVDRQGWGVIDPRKAVEMALQF
jgi:subtilisin family serine protease